MKIKLGCVLVAMLLTLASAQNPSAAKGPESPSYKAGGTPVVIPPPTNELVEMGSDDRSLMGVFVPDSNRLLAAFVLADDLSILQKGGKKVLSKYCMVEVLRSGEFTDFGLSDFKEMTADTDKEIGKVMNSAMQESEDELNRKMKALDSSNKVSLGEPIQLGRFFSKPDAYGFGLGMPISVGGTIAKVAVGISLLRVKNRLLFVYVYSQYKDQDSLTWLRKTAESWTDAIQQANK